MISYSFEGSEPVIIMTERVLDHFRRHQQRTAQCPEAGGQLFARLEAERIVCIARATGPRRVDRRGRSFFSLNRWAARRETRRLFKHSWHFVGDWHTHPEPRPRPSAADIRSIQEMFVKSRHSLESLVLVVVGTDAFPAGLFVALVTPHAVHKLTTTVRRPEKAHRARLQHIAET